MSTYESEPIDSMDLIFSDDPFGDWPEPQYGEPGYDYGLTDDGWPIPPPCIICGVPEGNCTEEHYLAQVEIPEEDA